MTPRLYRHQSLPSTMDEARRLAENGEAEGAVVQALEQTAGRGRFGNQWSSPQGNLYMTLLLRPRVPVRHVAQMSFAAALALADTIERDDVRLKWPNDVLAGGRKIAGILLEMQSGAHEHPAFLLIGTGVNVNAAPPGCASFAENTSAVDVDAVRDALLANIARWYTCWQNDGFADIRAAWLARAHGLGQPVTARLADRTLHGVFEGIDPTGNLLLRQDDGQVRAISSGAVHFAPTGQGG